MRDEQTEQLFAAAIEVHRLLGPGLLEPVYEDALCIEFSLRGIPCQRQQPYRINYKGHPVRGQRIDLIAFSEIVIEVKAQKPNAELFQAQAIAYLKVTGLKRALILNFGLPTLIRGVQRVVHGGA